MRVLLASLTVAGIAVAGFSTAASGHSGTPRSWSIAQLGRQLSAPHRTTSVLVPTRRGAGSQTFTDPTGDSNNDAPDISTIDVSNDDAGNITMTVSFANRFSDLKDNDGFEIVMDTDNNPSTGGGGFDYIYVGIKDRNGLFVWSGSTFTGASANSVHGSSGAGKAGVTLNRADLGNATVLHFYVESTRDLGETFGDEAPNGTAVYTYNLVLSGAPPTTTTPTTTATPTPPPPLPPAPTPTPKFVVAGVGTPHAGKRFLVRARVAIGDLSASPASLACTAKDGTARVRTAVQNGPPPFKACALTVPAGTAGKTLVVVLTIHYKAAVATRTLRFKIR